MVGVSSGGGDADGAKSWTQDILKVECVGYNDVGKDGK